MKLKSFGCSFVYGCDLHDTGPANQLASKHSWAALMAQQLGYEYQCFAKPGAGNLAIIDRIFSQIDVSDHNDLFVIGWTWIDRFDYQDPNKDSDWLTAKPGSTDRDSLWYFKTLHSEYRDKLTSLTLVKLAIDTLQQKSIPFVMTYMDELMFDSRWHTSPAVAYLQQFVQSHMTTFEGQTFLDWSRHHGYAESSTWHPLEQAHQSAAEYMIKVFDTQKTVDPARLVLS